MNALSPPSFLFADSSLLQDNVAFVLCLDTVGNGDSLHLHVSKPPKEGSPQYSLLKELEMVRTDVHKRITLPVCVFLLGIDVKICTLRKFPFMYFN